MCPVNNETNNHCSFMGGVNRKRLVFFSNESNPDGAHSLLLRRRMHLVISNLIFLTNNDDYFVKRALQSSDFFIPSSTMYVVLHVILLFHLSPPCFAASSLSVLIFRRLAYDPARFMTSSRKRRSLSSSSLDNPFLTALTPRTASKAIGMMMVGTQQ